MRRLLASLALLALLATPAEAATVVVEVRSNVYEPAAVEIDAGDRVTWRFTAPNHSVTSDGNFDSHPQCPVQCSTANSPNFSVTFDRPGTYSYYCKIHRGAGMVGSVNVRGQVVPLPTTTTTAAPTTTTTTSTTVRSTTTTTTTAPTTTTSSSTTTTTVEETTTSTSSTTTSTTVAITGEDEGESDGDGGGAVLILLAILAVLGGGGYALWRFWPGRQEPQAPAGSSSVDPES